MFAMSAASCLLSGDQFLCSICQDVFTDPVSTPCGHNFCKTCIAEHWNKNVPCQCPNCNKIFSTKPELQVNTLISEMVARFRQSAQHEAASSSEQNVSRPGEVPCDVCPGTRLKALKSCLVCVASYCETHLQPHLTAPPLKRHQLIEPVENLEDTMCTEHNQLLELFCKIEQTCVCMLCTVSDHKGHEVVPLAGQKKAELQQMIQERRLKIQGIRDSVVVSRANADREIADGVRIFTKLKDTAEVVQAKVTEEIEKKHKEIENLAEVLISELEQETSALEKRRAELEQLSLSEDHIRLLQDLLSLKAAPPSRDWKDVSVCCPSYAEEVRAAINELKRMLSDMAELKALQRFAVDVRLDPDTAHPLLILSHDGKQVSLGPVRRDLPDNPERFSVDPCVLGMRLDSSRQFYFEVEVKGKIRWIVGVARESVNRKETVTIYDENGYWTLCCSKEKEYRALSVTPVELYLMSKPEKVGVFVDYDEGLVSFYDVNAARHIFTFSGCNFTQRILPFFCPSFDQGGTDSVPLTICPVNTAE
uniref:E3 ubiquitin-protein ligase TRIM41-like n=1 Tax=Scatophagus argus TaxID=75038 RepID=UPI001ED7D1D1|nr:E3 ubiquitin-protein ligase TRIM41-like [Scatophagus argus]